VGVTLLVGDVGGRGCVLQLLLVAICSQNLAARVPKKQNKGGSLVMAGCGQQAWSSCQCGVFHSHTKRQLLFPSIRYLSGWTQPHETLSWSH
jgi:hypothetical protein